MVIVSFFPNIAMLDPLCIKKVRCLQNGLSYEFI